MPDVQHCVRCGTAGVRRGRDPWRLPPDDWEGTILEAVCPNCQLAEWHPHCISAVTFDEPDRALDLKAIPAAELDSSMMRYCDHIDLSVAVTGDVEVWPTDWVCPVCGGREFDWVHADFPTAGV